jgi:hypothetical protein
MSACVVATASAIRARSSSKFAGTGGKKGLSLTYPHKGKVQAIVVAKIAVHEKKNNM